MAVKLNSKEQRELDLAVSLMKGLRATLSLIAEDLGAAEIKMWALARKLGKGKDVLRIDHASAKAKLVFRDEE